MPPALANLIRLMLGEIDTLVSGLEFLGVAEWQRQFERIIIEYHAAAYMAGKGIDDIDARGDALLGVTMQAQIDYLAGFADRLDSLSEAQIAARAALYAGSLKTSYSQGQHPLDLPFYPADGGTVCGNNCQCEWVVTGDRAIWRLRSGESCSDCEARAAGNPYVVGVV